MFFFGLIDSTILFAAGLAVTATVFTGADPAIAIILITLYALALLIHVIRSAILYRRRGFKGPGFAAVTGYIAADFTNPFRGLFALRGVRKVIDGSRGRRAYSWGVQWLHLIWSIVVLFAVVVLLASMLT